MAQVDPKNPVAKKDLMELKTKLKSTKKIEEVEVKSEVKETIKTPSSPVKEEEATPKKVVKGNKTKNLDAETVSKAANLATQEASNLVLKSIPKTAAGFEKDYN